MKSRLTIIKLLFIACGMFAATAAFGAVQTWNGGTGFGTGTDIGVASNWSGTLPSTANGDTAQWDGVVPGPLNLIYNGGLASGFGQNGINFAMTANQSGSVNISSPVASAPNLAIWTFLNNSANAGFSLGGTTANKVFVAWRPGNADELHTLENNSTSPVIIYPNVAFVSGGGVNHVLLFQGSGDFRLTNNMIVNNSPSTTIQKTGGGTLYWNGPSISGALGNGTIASPITIAGGTLVLQNNTVLSPLGSGNVGSQRIDNNGTLFKYDAPSLTQVLTGIIAGSSPLEVANGTLTLSGASTYIGNTTLSGGTLVVNGAENVGISGPLGVGGTISFTGGALQFSANNTFDYSSRFSAAASQAYRIDSGGQNVTLSSAFASTGGTFTKTGSGTLTLVGASSYSGLTTVSAGRLVFQGAKSGSGNITVADGATLGVTTGTQVTPSVLTVGSSSGATLGFNGVVSTVTPLMAAGTLTTAGTITINVNSGTFAVGQSYPLLSWTTGAAPTVTLGTLNGALGNLSIVGNTLKLNVTGLAYVWTGATDGNWNTATLNWILNGGSAAFANGNAALFDDTATGQTNVTLTAPISQLGVTVNSSKTYSIVSSGANVIGGAGGLTKNGNSMLTLSGGVNSYSGATTLSGGSLAAGALANGGLPSDIGSSASGATNLVFDSGKLSYTGGSVAIDRLFTVTTGGGTIDASGSGALALNNSGVVGLSGTGARVMTLAGTNTDNNTLAASIGDNGGATSLTKSGAGTWVLTGNNANSGATTIAAGVLQIGAGGAAGSLGSGNVVNNGALVFNRTGSVTNGTISGTGTVTNNGSGTLVLPGNNSYAGATVINAGTVQVGTGGATGKLAGTAPVVNNGTFIFNSTGSSTLTGSGLISGTGNVIIQGAGNLFQAIGGNTYTGWTQIDPGATFQPAQGNQGALVSSVVTNNGSLLLVRQDNGVFIYSGPIVGTGSVVLDANNANNGDVTLTGTNTYTGGTIIRNNTLILGDPSVPGGGTILGNVLFTNSPTANENTRRIVFNHPEDLTVTNLITYSTNLAFGNRGILEQRGTGTLTLLANNDYPGGTVVSNGVLQVGNGGTTGAIGTGPVNINTRIDFNRAGDLSYGVNATFSGAGSVVQKGPGTLTINGTNNIFGSLTVSNGSLFMNNDNFALQNDVIAGTLGGTGAFFGPITLNAGTALAPGASVGTVGTLTAYGSLTIGGNVAVELNKSVVPPNDLVVANGGVTKTGAGTLTVANVGTPIVIGDKFTLFSQAVSGGASLTVTGAGVTWQNDLATDGSITALTSGPSVNPNPPVMQVSVSAGIMSLAWPTNLGWTLQTNSVSLTAANQWFPYPGSASVTNVNIPIIPGKTNVFFRMVYP